MVNAKKGQKCWNENHPVFSLTSVSVPPLNILRNRQSRSSEYSGRAAETAQTGMKVRAFFELVRPVMEQRAVEIRRFNFHLVTLRRFNFHTRKRRCWFAAVYLRSNSSQ